MQTIFLKYVSNAWTTQFVRDDMEQGNWTQEEYSVNMTFPYVPGKVIERGMRVAFHDPATDNLEMFEIRNVTNIEPDHYQQIIGEHIAISELTDEHIDNAEITDKTAAQAVTTVLSGTLWSLGNNTASGTSSGDVGRGSVWQAIIAIQTNWNVYITPRVTLNSAGSITGRYLDVAPAQGTWRGVRLSIDKNMSDASVVYDDSEVLTAMYGYGGMIDVENATTFNTSKELDFSGVAWSATSAHPAKPMGQKYLEYPEKTALYGRNGRPRYGYYQNSDITDANTLLEKTWEALKATCDPKISITGTAADLYRLGYKDEPLRLHDTVIVEIRQTGETFQKEIIKLDVDLLDPTASRPEIGAYIPNIIYINRDTNEYATTGATGGRGGGGGGRGQSNATKYEYDTYSGFEKRTDEYGSMIAMVVGKYDGNEYIKAGEIGLAINKTGESGSYETTAYINADHVNISATQTAYSLAGDLEHDANGKLVIKSAGGMYVQRTESGVTSQFGVFDNGNLTAGVIATKVNGETSTHIYADNIVMSSASDAKTVKVAIDGKLTTTELESQIALLSAVRINTLNITTLVDAPKITGTEALIDDISCDYLSLSGSDSFDDCVIDATPSGNVLTITYASGRTETFSKATTQTGSWSSGVFTSTAYQNGVALPNPLTTSLTAGAASWDGKTVTIPIYATIGSSATVYNTGKTVSATYSGGGDYDAGWNACRNAMIESQYQSSYYQGTQTTKYDAPTYGAQARTVLYPFNSVTITRYSVPDPR